MAGNDVIYHNNARERAEEAGRRIHDGAQPTEQAFRRDIHRGTATERQAVWDQILQHRGANDTAQQHLPQGFTITGADGHHVVKDKSGRTVYDEHKTDDQVHRDSRIGAGEGPYSALRRQGMSDAEARKAASDMKATAGRGEHGQAGFRQGESVEQQKDGQGAWHKEGREQARHELEGRLQQQAQDERQVRDTFGTPGLTRHNQQTGQQELGMPEITSRLANPLLPEAQRKSFEFMRDHYRDLSEPKAGTTHGARVITRESLDRYYLTQSM